MPYKFLILCFNEKLMPPLTKSMKKGLSILLKYNYKYRRLIYVSPLLQFRALKFLIKPYLFWWLYFIYIWFMVYIKTLFSLWIRCMLVYTQLILYPIKYKINLNFLWFLIVEEGKNQIVQFSKKQFFYYKFFFWVGLNRVMRWKYSMFPPFSLSYSFFIKRAMWQRRYVFFIDFLIR